MRFIKIALLLVLGLAFTESIWYLLHSDLLFHTDIARDFLLFEDIVTKNPLTLIGPRSGGIPGVFHGPLWLYLHIPAYILGEGGPVVVAGFWVFMCALLVFFTYYVAKKFSNTYFALACSALVALRIAPEAKGLFNAFGAVLLAPIFFYLLHRYLKTVQSRYLAGLLFTLGVSIQFQIAFALPILFLTTLYIAPTIFKKRLFRHIFSYLALVPPLLSYIIFETRHQFLQLHAIIAYISGSDNPGKLDPIPFLINRMKGMFVEGVGLSPYFVIALNTVLLILLGVALYIGHKKGKISQDNPVLIFLYLYVGYWLTTFLFSGVVWGYYYWPFMPMAALALISSHGILKGKIVPIFLALLLTVGCFQSIYSIQQSNNVIRKDAGSWQFNKQLAEDAFKGQAQEFGYYIYTPDLFGYSQRFAMDYTQKQNKVTAVPFQKRTTTILIIAPAPKDKPWLNETWWKKHQVKITTKPYDVISYTNNFKIEKYRLTTFEQEIKSDENLINTLHFR